MELDALEGSSASVTQHRPILLIESIKTDKAKLRAWLEKLDYHVFPAGRNFLAIHQSDRSREHVKQAVPKTAA
jgi:hypothetical protein